jgi:hypothetical protein
MDVLRCLTPSMVLKELAMHRIAYNLIRALMQRAALTYDVDLERISFKGSLDSLHHFADAIYATHRKPCKQALLFNALLRTIASNFGPTASQSLRTSRSKTSPKKLSIPYQTSSSNAPKPSEESPLNVAYLRAILDNGLTFFLITQYVSVIITLQQISCKIELKNLDDRSGVNRKSFAD